MIAWSGATTRGGTRSDVPICGDCPSKHDMGEDCCRLVPALHRHVRESAVVADEARNEELGVRALDYAPVLLLLVVLVMPRVILVPEYPTVVSCD